MQPAASGSLRLLRPVFYRTPTRPVCIEAKNRTLGEINRDRALAYVQKYAAQAPLKELKTPAELASEKKRAKTTIRKQIPKVDGTIPAPESLKTLLESEHGALEVSILDVRDKAAFANYMIICTGHAPSHIRAIADGIRDDMRSGGVTIDGEIVGVCGRDSHEWVVVDIGPVIVHVMVQEARQHYNLEELWTSDELPTINEDVA